jgi:hypothetical protein
VTKCAVLISTTESDKGLHVYYIPTCPHLQDHHNYYCYYYYSFDNIEEWLGYHIQYNKLPVCAFTTPAIARYSTTTVRDTSIRVPQNRKTQVQYFGAATPLLPRALPTATTTYTTYRPTLRAPAGQLDICGPRESPAVYSPAKGRPTEGRAHGPSSIASLRRAAGTVLQLQLTGNRQPVYCTWYCTHSCTMQGARMAMTLSLSLSLSFSLLALSRRLFLSFPPIERPPDHR